MYRGIIYKYTSPSGKVYIGQTTNERRRRWQFNSLQIKYGSNKIDNARKKYGPTNFQYEILFECKQDNLKVLTSILDCKEIELIKYYNSVDLGYNCAFGGILNTRGVKLTTKQINILKIANSKIVYQYDLFEKFLKCWNSTMEIERELGIPHALISKNCNGQTKHCREYIFTYTKGVFKVPERIHNTKRVQIIEFDLNHNFVKSWPSLTSLAKYINIDRKVLKEKLINKELFYNNSYFKIK